MMQQYTEAATSETTLALKKHMVVHSGEMVVHSALQWREVQQPLIQHSALQLTHSQLLHTEPHCSNCMIDTHCMLDFYLSKPKCKHKRHSRVIY